MLGGGELASLIAAGKVDVITSFRDGLTEAGKQC